MGMNVLSCFDGISGGQIALNNAGIRNFTYYASEIDKSAIAITQHNYPDTIQLGDITKWREWNLPKIDLLIAGSPCQGFSRMGKELNFNDPRSSLFFTFIELLKELKPKYVLLENVKMRKEWQDVISEAMGGIQPRLINSLEVTPQNRERLYWYNWEDNTALLVGNYPPSLDTVVDRDARPIILHNLYGGFKEDKPRVFTNFCPTLRTACGGGHIPSVVLRDNPVFKNWTNFEVENYFHNISNRQLKILHEAFPMYRTLNIRECERIQTLPRNYVGAVSGISNTAKYSAIGNGWTVTVVAYLFSQMPLTPEEKGFIIGVSEDEKRKWDYLKSLNG